MAMVLSVGGIARGIKRKSLDLSETANSRTNLRVAVDSVDGTYRTANGQVTTLVHDGTPIFGGYVLYPEERGLADFGPSITNTFDAVDWTQLADRRVVTETYAAGMTVRDIVDDLRLKYLDVFSVTLDPTMPAGTVLGEVKFTRLQLTKALSLIAEMAWDEGGYFVINPAKALGMFQVGTLPAPWTITPTTPNHFGDIWTSKTWDGYSNRIIIEGGIGDKTILLESHFGDGVVRVFTVDYPVKEIIGTIRTSTASAEQEHAVGRFGIDDMPWTFDAATNTLRQRAAETVLGASDWVRLNEYVATFPKVVIATDATAYSVFGGVGPWEAVIPYTQIFDKNALAALAATHLARALLGRQPMRYRTLRAGLHAGMMQPVLWPLRDLNSSFFISTIRLAEFEDTDQFVYDVNAYSTVFPGTWKDDWSRFRGTAGGGSGGGAFTISSGGTVTASSQPFPLGGSLDNGISGALSKPARSSIIVYGNHAPGKTAIPIVGGRVRLVGETLAPVIKDNLGNVVSALGSVASPGTITSATDDVWAPMTPFVVDAAKQYRLWGNLGATGHTGFLIGYLYAA